MRTCRVLILAFFLLGIAVCGLSTSYASVPHLINYQGRLTDKSSVPLSGSYTLTFTFYDAETAGTPLWKGTYNNVAIAKGIFSILLGDINDSSYKFEDLAFDKQYWLEIKVGNDIMSPRQRLTSAAYAFRADKAEAAVKATAIEVRSTDPSNPVTGQIWYRDDLGKLKIFDGSGITLIPPEPQDLIQLSTTTHDYGGGGVGAQSIDGNYNTAQSVSYSGGDGGSSCSGRSTHTFSKPRNLTMLKYKIYAHAHDDGHYYRVRSASIGIYYWTSGASDWSLVPGTSNSDSGGGDGEATVDSGVVNVAVDLRNVTKIEARVNASSSASGGEGHFSGDTAIYEIQAIGL